MYSSINGVTNIYNKNAFWNQKNKSLNMDGENLHSQNYSSHFIMIKDPKTYNEESLS